MSESALLSAKESASYCSRSAATWWRLNSAGKIPKPIKLGGGTFWNRQELATWVAAGCPDRGRWEATKKAGAK